MSFGELFTNTWPENISPVLSEFGKKLLGECVNIEKPSFGDTTVSDIIKASSNFPIEFPINTCRIQNQPKERHSAIRSQLASAYPIIHERVLHLYIDFLEHKCRHANRVENYVYPKLSLVQFVQRLLAKRCVAFCGRIDAYILLSGETGTRGFFTIGSELEQPPLILRNVLSYEEIKLSALLSVSSHSEFLNDGNRYNVGVIEKDKSKIEEAGVIIGLIGARLSVPGEMEFQDIVISKSQNTTKNGYGQKSSGPPTREGDYRKVWKNFYQEEDFIFDEVEKNGKRFGETFSRYKDNIFDNLIMKKRYAISFDTLLLESEARAAAAGKQAYIHVVGIGLGVWSTAVQQEEIFLLTFTERLKALLPQLNHISFVHFSYFDMRECGELKDGGMFHSKMHPNGGIRTYLSNRNPAHKLPDSENLLLIVSYAWDGNALPGNEFWMNKLAASGDPSTACSTLVTEIHNPHINSQMICGENLHIASPNYGVIHISEYSKRILKS